MHRPNIDMIFRSEWVQQLHKKPESPSTNPLTIIQKRKKASFWCTKSRKTSPLSNQPLKQPEPIECYTKKYNNVPVEKFKNPLEQEGSLSSAMTVVPVHNHLNTINRNNSLINSSKIVKKNQIEIVQNNDIIQVRSLRSYSNDDPSQDDEASTASEKDFDKFMKLPSRVNGDTNALRALNPLEQEVRKLMNKLGISETLLEKHIEQGPRSEIIGIYRILIMRLKTQKEQASVNNNNSSSSNLLLGSKNHNNNSSNRHQSHKSERRRKHMCAIL
jgi:serine/threonine-protein kinase NIM1